MNELDYESEKRFSDKVGILQEIRIEIQNLNGE